MALIACPECGHNISSLARFCPKCKHSKSDAAWDIPQPDKQAAAGNEPARQAAPAIDASAGSQDDSRELHQHEFSPTVHETIYLEGRTFLVNGVMNVSDCYAYLTTKRFAVCDASRINIIFQISGNGFASIEEGRHLVSKKIIISTVYGETYHLKCHPHDTWLGALLDPQGYAGSLKRAAAGVPSETAGILDWFYEADGVSVGPVKEDDVIQTIRNNHTIFRTTRVWNKSLPGWKPAGETILTIYFSDSSPSGGGLTLSAKVGRMLGLGIFPHIQTLCRKYF